MAGAVTRSGREPHAWPDNGSDMKAEPIMMCKERRVRDNPSVAELVSQARNGDKHAWNALIELYAPLVWSICRRYRLDRADAEDVGQTVWLRLVDQLDRLRDPDALPGWLVTTTRATEYSYLDAGGHVYRARVGSHTLLADPTMAYLCGPAQEQSIAHQVGAEDTCTALWMSESFMVELTQGAHVRPSVPVAGDLAVAHRLCLLEHACAPTLSSWPR